MSEWCAGIYIYRGYGLLLESPPPRKCLKMRHFCSAVLESISRYAGGPKYWALLVLEQWAASESGL